MITDLLWLHVVPYGHASTLVRHFSSSCGSWSNQGLTRVSRENQAGLQFSTTDNLWNDGETKVIKWKETSWNLTEMGSGQRGSVKWCYIDKCFMQLTAWRHTLQETLHNTIIPRNDKNRYNRVAKTKAIKNSSNVSRSIWEYKQLKSHSMSLTISQTKLRAERLQ